MVTRKDKRRECPHCGRVTDNVHETTCTACGYLTREVKKVVTKGKASKPEEVEHNGEGMVDLSEEE
jgi:ribosomal protein L37E